MDQIHPREHGPSQSSTDNDVGGDGCRASSNGTTANNPLEHSEPWMRLYNARQLMSSEERMDDFLKRIGEPSWDSGLAKEVSTSLRFVGLPRRGAPFEAAFMMGGGSSNASSEDPGGTNTPDRSLPGGGGRRSDNFCDDNATGTVDGEDVTDTVFGKGKGKEKQRPSTRPPWTADEDAFLRLLVQEQGGGDWATKAARLNEFLTGARKDTRRTSDECFGRWKMFLDAWMKQGVTDEVRKRSWSTEELNQLWYVAQASTDKTWVSIASALPGKTPEQCKEGWLHVPWKWTPQQDTVLLHAYMTFGPRWKQVANLLPQHTEGEVRIRTYSPTFAEKWKTFSSTVPGSLSLQVVRRIRALLAPATAIPGTLAPATITNINSTKKRTTQQAMLPYSYRDEPPEFLERPRTNMYLGAQPRHTMADLVRRREGTAAASARFPFNALFHHGSPTMVDSDSISGHRHASPTAGLASSRTVPAAAVESGTQQPSLPSQAAPVAHVTSNPAVPVAPASSHPAPPITPVASHPVAPLTQVPSHGYFTHVPVRHHLLLREAAAASNQDIFRPAGTGSRG